MSNKSELRLAVIGAGGWGKTTSGYFDQGVLSAVCDTNEERCREVAARFNTRYYTCLDEMLCDELKLHGCVVYPTKTHFGIAKK